MSYDPLFDAARQATDEVFGEGAYARLNRNNPGVPIELRRPAGYWMFEASGVLAPVVKQYIRGVRGFTNTEIRILKAYLAQWVGSLTWDENPYLNEEGRAELASLRERAEAILNIADVDRVIAQATELGMDPL